MTLSNNAKRLLQKQFAHGGAYEEIIDNLENGASDLTPTTLGTPEPNKAVTTDANNEVTSLTVGDFKPQTLFFGDGVTEHATITALASDPPSLEFGVNCVTSTLATDKVLLPKCALDKVVFVTDVGANGVDVLVGNENDYIGYGSGASDIAIPAASSYGMSAIFWGVTNNIWAVLIAIPPEE